VASPLSGARIGVQTSHGHAAVHVDDLAGDVGGSGVQRQELDDARHLLWLAVPPCQGAATAASTGLVSVEGRLDTRRARGARSGQAEPFLAGIAVAVTLELGADVSGTGQPPRGRTQGDVLQDGRLVLGVDRGCHVRRDKAGRDGVAQDVAAGELARHGLCQAQDARLPCTPTAVDLVLR
jgi:hypothetical protein